MSKFLMDNIVQKRPFIVSEDQCKRLTRIPLSENVFKEEWIQRLLQNSPQLLPVDEIDPVFSPLVCIGREVRTPAGPIDNLYISPKGYITIVETKLWRNPEARREVVGQILDYTKELKQFSFEDLDKAARQYNKLYYNKDYGLFEMIVKAGLLAPDDESLFIDLVEKNLSSARFLLLIVGDGIREGVWRMAKFLNETPNLQYTLALVQLEVYQMPRNEKLVIPNLLLETKTIERGVFRFVNGELQSVDLPQDMGDKQDVIRKFSLEDFDEALKENNPNLDVSTFSNFLTDLEDLGYTVSTSGKKDLVIKYPMPRSKQLLNVIYISSDSQKGAFKYRGTMEKDLEKFGYSSEIAKEFFNKLTPYLISGQEESKSMNYSIEKILSDYDQMISIFEKLTSYF